MAMYGGDAAVPHGRAIVYDVFLVAKIICRILSFRMNILVTYKYTIAQFYILISL